jgi:hypothetical protein
MRHTTLVLLASVALLALLTQVPDTYADESVVSPAAEPSNQTTPAGGPFAVAPLSDKALSNHRGGAEVVLNNMKLDGVVSDNKAFNLITGTNTITDNAFAGATGLPMVIQNSGNNVLIQNATIVNVQLK